MNPKKVTVLAFLVLLIVPAVCFALPFDIGATSGSGVAWPKLSFKAVADKSYALGVESYFTQHFLERDQFLRLKTTLDVASGKKETNDVYLSESRLLQKVTLPTDESMRKSIESINRFASNSDKQIYFLLIPTAAEIYKETLPAYSPKADELAFINKTYSQLHSSITTLDAATPLTNSKEGEIFYRTDRRLTSYGAYSIYNYNIKSMGSVPAKLSDFSIEHLGGSFYGSLYKKTQYSLVKPDTIDLYHYAAKQYSSYVTIRNGTETTFHDNIYFRDRLTLSDPLSVFLGGTKPFINIQTDNQAKKNLLIFTDGNLGAMSQFLTIHYDDITIVDLSYLTEYYRDSIDFDRYDNVLFYYSTPSMLESDKFGKLSLFSK